MELNEKLEKLVKKYGNGRKAASALGVTYMSFWSWKTGKYEPSKPVMLLIDERLKDDVRMAVNE